MNKQTFLTSLSLLVPGPKNTKNTAALPLVNLELAIRLKSETDCHQKKEWLKKLIRAPLNLIGQVLDAESEADKMNVLTKVKFISELNEREVQLGVVQKVL